MSKPIWQQSDLERKAYYRKLFYQKWGTYQNYLNYKKNTSPQKKVKKVKSDFVLQVGKSICLVCKNKCEAVLREDKFSEIWFPIGFKCSCGFFQKASILK